MTSQTIAENWPGRICVPDKTPLSELKSDKQNGQDNSLLEAEPQEGTMVAAFFDVIQQLSPGNIEMTPIEPYLEGAKDFSERESETLPSDETQKVITQRVKLLAREYVRGQTPESEARIEILTEKLRKQLPPVSDSQWDELAAIADKLDEMDKRHQQLRERLGLK